MHDIQNSYLSFIQRIPNRILYNRWQRRMCTLSVQLFSDITSVNLVFVRILKNQLNTLYIVDCSDQGYNARKVISEVYASFVLSLGGNVNTRRMSKPDMGSIFHIKKSMKYSGHRNLLCELSKLSKFKAFNLLGY